jgi:hypothetical protein
MAAGKTVRQRPPLPGEAAGASLKPRQSCLELHLWSLPDLDRVVPVQDDDNRGLLRRHDRRSEGASRSRPGWQGPADPDGDASRGPGERGAERSKEWRQGARAGSAAPPVGGCARMALGIRKSGFSHVPFIACRRSQFDRACAAEPAIRTWRVHYGRRWGRLEAALTTSSLIGWKAAPDCWKASCIAQARSMR